MIDTSFDDLSIRDRLDILQLEQAELRKMIHSMQSILDFRRKELEQLQKDSAAVKHREMEVRSTIKQRFEALERLTRNWFHEETPNLSDGL